MPDLTPDDYQKIRDEIENDPEGLGYAPHKQAGSHAAIADLLCSPRGDAVMDTLTRAQFTNAYAAIFLRLGVLPADRQAFWTWGNNVLSNLEHLSHTDPVVQGVFQALKAETLPNGLPLTTDEEIAALTPKRPLERWEEIGVTQRPHHLNVARALRSEEQA